MADWRTPHGANGANGTHGVDLSSTPVTDGTALAGTVPHTLFDERWRVLRAGAAADRRNHGARFRRRALIPAAVASGVLAGTGLLSAWATSSTPASSVTTSPASAAPAPTPAELKTLAQLQRTLNADRAAIAALPKTLPAAGTPAGSTGATTAASSATPASTAAPSAPTVPTLPPLPAINVATPPPATQGTTGASGLP